MSDAPVSQDITAIATALGVVVGATSLVIGVINARGEQNAKRMEREAQTLQAMNARFQAMAADRRELDNKTRSGAGVSAKEVYAFYAGYWALQIDQWEHYRLGVISSKVYLTWTCYLFDTLAGFHRLGDIDSRASWEQVGRSLSRNNIEFRILVERLYKLSGEYREGLGRQSAGGTPIDRLTLRAKVRRVLATTPRWINGDRVSATDRALLVQRIQPFAMSDHTQ